MTNVLCLSLKPLASSSSTVRGSIQPGDEGSPGPAQVGNSHSESIQGAGHCLTHIRTDFESHIRTDFQLVLDRPPLPALLFNL